MLLEKHLEQIEICSATIFELPFHPPQIFTNAMLNSNDITALIRDTESHERALFSIAPREEYLSSTDIHGRRSTLPNMDAGGRRTTQLPAPRKNTAVASILGGDLAERIRREQRDERAREGTVQKEHLDVNLLLKGAEKLCGVYPMPGAAERIANLRIRYSKVLSSVAQYEELISEQAVQMHGRAHQPSIAEDEEEIETSQPSTLHNNSSQHLTKEELQREEASIRELEQKKRSLEQRVIGMDKDLGGLLR